MLVAAATVAHPKLWIGIGVLVIVAIVAAIVVARRRSTDLRSTFGSEYDRTVERTGSRQRAEAELAHREQRVERFDLRELSPGARDRYAAEWRGVQERFLDEPRVAIGEADRLVTGVMQDKGYPSQGFDQRVADLSVRHAADLDHYRAARAISLRNDRGLATTEDMRQALVHYRALFASLLGVDPVGASRQ